MPATMPPQVTIPDDLTPILNTLANHETRIKALETAPQPPNPIPALPETVGGWNLENPFARGGFAYDPATRRLRMVGHSQRSDVFEYILPPMGQGPDPAAWPVVSGTAVKQVWPPFAGENTPYVESVAFWQGKFWYVQRVYYNTGTAGNVVLYADDGQTMTIPVYQQTAGGFGKGKDGTLYLAAGGNPSGQGGQAGVAMATIDATAPKWLIGPAGNFGAAWDFREDRPCDGTFVYWTGDKTTASDWWGCLNPRTINGVLVGKWASDMVYGGCHVSPAGADFWVTLGCDEINYNFQGTAFSHRLVTCRFRFPKNADGTFSGTPQYLATPFNQIGGQDWDEQGRPMLAELGRYQGMDPTPDQPIVRVLAA